MNRFWNWLAGLTPAAVAKEDAVFEATLALRQRKSRLAVHLSAEPVDSSIGEQDKWLALVPILEKLTQRIEELERREPPEETE